MVLAYLRAQAEALTSLDPMVRRDEPDAVHQMRVAARRLRSALPSFRPVIHSGDTERLGSELRWLGSVLGGERDSEVLQAHLEGHLREAPAEEVVGPVQARVQTHFARRRAGAHEAVLAALGSERYFALLGALDRLIAEPPFTAAAARPAGEVLPEIVARTYRQTARRMRRAERAPAGQARGTALHQARKAAKRARYAGEAVAPAAGKPARRFTKRLKKVQSVLGEHQDTVIARQVERELGMSAHLAGENAYTYGLLHERETHEGEQLQRQARKAWKRASRARFRRWLG